MEWEKQALKQTVELLAGMLVERIETTTDTLDIKNLTSALKDLVIIESIRIEIAQNTNTE